MRCLTPTAFSFRCLWSLSELSQGPAQTNSVGKRAASVARSSPAAGGKHVADERGGEGGNSGQSEFGFSTLLSFQYSPDCLAFTVID